jgi:hypothetical protein
MYNIYVNKKTLQLLLNEELKNHREAQLIREEEAKTGKKSSKFNLGVTYGKLSLIKNILDITKEIDVLESFNDCGINDDSFKSFKNKFKKGVIIEKTPKKLTKDYVCAICGSSLVEVDGGLTWNPDEHEWTINTISEHGICVDCDKQVIIVPKIIKRKLKNKKYVENKESDQGML